MGIPLQQLETKYEILDKIREGGMGAIYKVRHRLLGDVRVVKVMRPQLAGDETHKSRFVREARAASRLTHPNIAQLYDYTVGDDGTAYIVMEFIPGWSLRDLLKADEMPPVPLAIEIGLQSLKAIGHIHRHGMVHRDISPDNLMLTRDVDGRPLVKLIDLGIARAIEGDARLTAQGNFVGKLRYTAPEHFDDEGGPEIGPASDLYSLGLVLYELLTGRYPISGDNPSSLIAGHAVHPPLDFAISDPDGRVGEALREVLETALVKVPSDRFANAERFAEELLATGELIDLSTADAQRILALTASPRPGENDAPGAEDGVGRAAETAPEEAPVAAIERLIEVEDFAGARAEIERLAEADPPAGLDEIRDRLHEIERIANGPLLHRLLDEARQDLADDRPAEAVAKLERAATIDADDPRVGELLEDARRAAELSASQESRRREIEGVAQTIAELLDADLLDEAAAELRRADERHGPHQRWSELRRRLEEAEAQAHLGELTRHVAQGRALARAERWDEAAEALRNAESLDGDNVDVRRLLSQVEEARVAAEERRQRDETLRTGVAEVEAKIAAEELLDARLLFADLERQLGAVAPLPALSAKLAEAEEQQRRARFEALLADVDRLAAEEQYEEAIDLLDRARAMRPDDEALDRRRDELREELRRLTVERHRQREAELAVGRIRELLAAGRLEAAEAVVGEARDDLGRHPDVEEAAAAVGEERRRHDASAIDEHLRQAARLAAAGEFTDALTQLRQAEDLDPRHETVLAEKERITSAADQQRRQKQRAAALSTAQQRVDELLARNDLEAAESELRRVEDEWGHDEALADHYRRLADLERRREERSAVEALLAEARRLSHAHLFAEALAKAREARDVAPLDRDVQDVVFALERKIEGSREDEKRRRARAEAEREIEQLVAGGDFTAAADRLPAALDVAGPTMILQNLHAQVAKELGEPPPPPLKGGAKAAARAETHGMAALAKVNAASEVAEADGAAEASTVLSSVAKATTSESDALAEPTMTVAALSVGPKEGSIPPPRRAETVLPDAAEEPTLIRPTAELATPSALKAAEPASEKPSATPPASVATPPPPPPANPVANEPVPVTGPPDAAETRRLEPPHAAETRRLEPPHAAETRRLEPPHDDAPASAGSAETEWSIDRTLSVAPGAMPRPAAAEGEEPETVAGVRSHGPPAVAIPRRLELSQLGFGEDDAPAPPPAAPAASPRRQPPPGESSNRLLIAAGVVLVAGSILVGIWLGQRRATASPTDDLAAEDVLAPQLTPGTLVIDALPWGEITAVVRTGGGEQPTLSERFTPTIMSLPPGTYRVTLRYPPTGASDEVELSVVSGGRVEHRFELEGIDGRDYFAQVW